MKKNTVIAILPVILFISITGCANESTNLDLPESDITTAAKLSENTEPVILQPNVPESDFGGYKFRFLVRNEEHMIFVAKDIYAESENGDIINDAVYKRNINIEEQYNINISQNAVVNPGNFIQKIIKAGDDAYDVLIEATIFSVVLVNQDMVYDLYEIPYLDFT